MYTSKGQTLFMVGFTFLLIAFILQIIGTTTNAWSTAAEIRVMVDYTLDSVPDEHTSYPGIDIGLFEICTEGSEGDMCYSYSKGFLYTRSNTHLRLGSGDALAVVRFLAIFVCLLSGIALVIFLGWFLLQQVNVRYWAQNRNNDSILRFAFILVIIAGSLGFLSCIIYGTIYDGLLEYTGNAFIGSTINANLATVNYLGYSYIACVMAALLYVVSGIILMVAASNKVSAPSAQHKETRTEEQNLELKLDHSPKHCEESGAKSEPQV